MNSFGRLLARLLLFVLVIGYWPAAHAAITISGVAANPSSGVAGPDGFLTVAIVGNVASSKGDAIDAVYVMEGNTVRYSQTFDVDFDGNDVPYNVTRSLGLLSPPASVTLPVGTHTLRVRGESWKNLTADSAEFVVTVAPAPLVPNAQPLPVTVPAILEGGQTFHLSVTMRNTGTMPWTPGGFALASVNGNAIWGRTSVSLPVGVNPGGQYTFEFDLNAPLSAGKYPLQWQMQSGSGAFGSPTSSSTVEVRMTPPTVAFDRPSPNQQFMSTGGTVDVQVSGTAQPAAGATIRSLTVLDNDVLIMTAPAGAASISGSKPFNINHHTLKLVAVDNRGLTQSATVQFDVQPPPATPPQVKFDLPNASKYFSTGGPVDIQVSGTAQPVGGATISSLVVKDNGRPILTAGQGATTIGGSSSFAIGAHNLTLEAVDSRGQSSVASLQFQVVPPVPVVSIGGPKQGDYFVTSNGSASVTVSGSAIPGTGASITKMQLLNYGSPIAGASSAGASFSQAVPLSANKYSLSLEATDSFNQTARSAAVNFEVVTGTAGDHAVVLSQTVPTLMRAGAPYNAEIRLLNTGTTTWTPGGQFPYRLGSQGPQDNRIWRNSGRVNLAGPVAPGAIGVFSFTVTAPSKPGAYQFQWKPLQEGQRWFDAATTPATITVVGDAGPVAQLAVTPTGAQVTAAGTATLTFSGSGSDARSNIVKLEVFQDKGLGDDYDPQPVRTVTGNAPSLSLNFALEAPAGVYWYKLRVTNAQGDATDSEPVVVYVNSGSLLGSLDGVRSDASGKQVLVGWVCQKSNAQALDYQVTLDSPGSSAFALATGKAALSSEYDNATVQGLCATPGAAHHFNVDLTDLVAQYSGRRLFVRAQAGADNIVLPCRDGSCVVPGSLRVGLTTPLPGSTYAGTGPLPVFMRAQLSGGKAPYDEVAFGIDGDWIAGGPDGALDAFSATKNGMMARAAPYAVQARVRQGNSIIYSMPSLITIGGSTVTLQQTKPADGAKLDISTPIALSVTITGAVETVASVKFYANDTPVATGVNSGGTWNASWNATVSGAFQLQARAFNGSGVQLGLSPAINVTLTAASGAAELLPVNITPPHLDNRDAGTLPGKLSVGSNGQGSYQMDLAVPPGSAGVQPALSLNYSGGSPNDIVGLGWSVGGLSRIHRCGKTVAQDGVNGRISFDKGDRLCLDGQRLVLVGVPVSDDNYWSGTAEYRTEIDSISRITAIAGPAGTAFKVESKDGRVATYGTTASSVVKAVLGTPNSGVLGNAVAQKSGPQSWALARVEDRMKNYIDFLYEQDTTTGEHHPVTIRYGGAGLQPHAAVTFEYEARDDAWKRYIDETRNDLRKRVTNIKTYVGDDVTVSGTLVRNYTLQYEKSPTSGRSLLKSVTVCPGTAVLTSPDCLPPTTFAWGKPDTTKTAGFVRWGLWPGAPNLATTGSGVFQRAFHADYFAFSDFENHGLTDVLEKRVASPVPPDINTRSGQEREATNPIPPGTMKSQYAYYHNTGSGFTKFTYQISTGEDFVVLSTGDFNGDGAPDLLVRTAKATRICLSPLGAGVEPAALLPQPITFTCDPNRPAVGDNFTSQLPYVVDIAGDGRAAHYGPYLTGILPTLCIQGDCQIDQQPPTAVLSGYPRKSTQPYWELRDVMSFNQMVDFAGVGKPYEVRWSKPYFDYETVPDPGGSAPDSVKIWQGLTPSVTMIGFGVPASFNIPASVPRISGMGSYDYPDAPVACKTGDCWPYIFTEPLPGASLSADFNGSGYSSLFFGYVQPYGATAKAEATLCHSTGRALDCGVRLKYSGAQYSNTIAVGQFVGDGQPTVLMENTSPNGSGRPVPNGTLRMCRLTGDDSTGGTGVNDTNMVCDDWGGGVKPTGDSYDQLLLVDLLGTGRMQALRYHFNQHAVNPDDGQWELFVPVDRAVPGQALDRIHQVTNGVGVTDTLEYDDGLTTGLVGASTPSTLTYPQHRLREPGKLVRRLRTGNGASPDRTVSYAYQDAAIDVAGRGALGFATVSSTDEQTGIVTTTNYRQDWPFNGMAASVTMTLNGCTLSNTVNTWDVQTTNSGGPFPYLKGSSIERRDLDCSDLGRTVTSNDYTDGWGNQNGQSLTVTGAGMSYSSEASTTYSNDRTRWLVGLPTLTTVSKTAPSAMTGGRTPLGSSVPVTRTVSWTYGPETGLLATETVEPDAVQFRLQTTYDRSGNAFGLVNKKIQSWIDPACASAGWPEPGCVASKQRTVQDVNYEPKGRFPQQIKNALGQAETHSYDAGSGARLSLTGPNLLTTSWTIDGLGRVRTEKRADGNETRRYLKQCAGDCPAGAAVAEVTEHFHDSARIATPTVDYSDGVHHVLRRQSWGFDGKAIVTDQRYNSLGQLYETDQPHFDGMTAYLASRQVYDALGRVTQVETRGEDNAVLLTTTEYKGYTTVLTNPRNQVRTETRNALGQLVKVQDARNGVTSFGYEPFGSLSRTVDPNGNVTGVEYDRLGRKIGLRDPDLGSIRYDVDPAGRTWAQTSPKQRAANDSTRFVFDLLDRMTARYEKDLIAHWVYDAAAKGIGQLERAYTGSGDNYLRVHSYDSLGRPSATTQRLTDGTYSSKTDYDAWGRPYRQTYQRGTDAAKVFVQRYNDKGYLWRLERGALALWQVTAQDAAQRPTGITLGNGLVQSRDYSPLTTRLRGASLQTAGKLRRLDEGYEYDALGNVSKRSQYWSTGGFDESFGYDELNRVTSSQVAGGALQSFTYDKAGNMQSKTGVGTGLYIYPPQGAETVADGAAPQPHAVQRIEGISGTFTYDVNGNQLTAPGRTATWSSFDMPLTLSKNGSTASFTYGPELQRTRQDRGDSTQVVYAGAQEVESKGGQVTVKTYWPLGVGVEIDRPGASSAELNWTHADRLGSPIAQSDEQGNLRERLEYDAWGKRRSADDNAGTSDTLDGKTDNRGYTGHEMLDQLDLVHMNGRVYDPLTAKFLSADPLVSDPTNGQNYNRYSYVLNNPTNLTDPTGFSCDTVTGTAICPSKISRQVAQAEMLGTTGTGLVKGTLTSADGNIAIHWVGRMSATASSGTGGTGGTGGAKQNASVASANSAPNGGLLTQLKDGYTGDNRSVMWSETGAERVGRYARNVVDFGVNLLPGSSLPEVGAQAGQGNYGGALLLLGTELLGPIGKEMRGVGAAERAVTAEGNYVYRGLAAGEDAGAGLTARMPGAGNSELSHVAGKRDTQWISTTKSLDIALSKYGENGVVRIDLSKVGSSISDVSGGFKNGGRMSNWARRDQEVLIKDAIPASAIERIK
ncbi:Ig-like domain-containing protein [Rugamonas sp. A1-17]|nr:Ig-like domain-containing protein [Rugamonas sp. A1-17]